MANTSLWPQLRPVTRALHLTGTTPWTSSLLGAAPPNPCLIFSNCANSLTSFPGIVVFAYCGVWGFKTPCTGSHYNTWGIRPYTTGPASDGARVT